MAKDKCTCNMALGFFGIVIMAVGAYFLVWGFMVQTAGSVSWSSWNWNAGLMYVIGLFLLCLGKRVKFSACGKCPIHN